MHTREEEPQDPTKNYDTRDLPIRGVAIGVAIFFAFTIIMAPVSCIALKAVGGNVGAPYVGHEPLPIADPEAYDSRKLPGKPHPLLQDNITAKADIHNLRKHENDLLEHGGKDLTTGLPVTPIEEAIAAEAAKHGS